MKPDKIKIEDLEVFANHGVFPEENVLGQKFVVSAVMYTDTRRAGLTDELTASIHYGEASAFITEYLKSHTFKLLEKVAEGLAEEMLVRIAGLQKVQIEIKKPWAPVGLPLKTVSVEIEREWHTAYIALGSNMGDSRSILEAAVQALDDGHLVGGAEEAAVHAVQLDVLLAPGVQISGENVRRVMEREHGVLGVCGEQGRRHRAHVAAGRRQDRDRRGQRALAIPAHVVHGGHARNVMWVAVIQRHIIGHSETPLTGRQ